MTIAKKGSDMTDKKTDEKAPEVEVVAPAEDENGSWIVYTDDKGKQRRVTVEQYRKDGLG